MNTCSHDGCMAKKHCRGLCVAHYKRLMRTNRPPLDGRGRKPANGPGKLSHHGYVVAYRHGHPLARPDGRVMAHRAVLFDKIGPGDHPCATCGRTVSWDKHWPADEGALVVDHMDADKTNNQPDNLAPSCQQCNAIRTCRASVNQTGLAPKK